MKLPPLPGSVPISRRRALQLMMTAAASAAIIPSLVRGANGAPRAKGYGPDPEVQKTYKPGELWPLTFTPAQRKCATALCDTIIPADGESPSASEVGVVDFLDEWISAPYDYDEEFDEYSFSKDRALFIEGLAWIDAEAQKRFGGDFADVTDANRRGICDDICYLPKAKPEFEQAAKFFARYRDLTAGGFYTTSEGTRDLKYIGNIPLATFDGPPPQVLRHVGLV